MNAQAIAHIVQRATDEPEFLSQLILSPQTALSGVPLSDTERQALSSRTPEQLLGLLASGGEWLECEPRTCQVTCEATCVKSVIDGDARVVGLPESSTAGIRQVVERIQNDPAFLRRLHQDPDSALAGVPLSRTERKALGANTSERLLGLMVGAAARESGCQGTCGYTCDCTCSGGYTMSCGTTCDYTCDYTAGFHLWSGLDVRASH